MASTEKISFVNDLAGKLKESQSVILADFRGLNVAQVTTLRKQLRAKEVEFKVVKNRLGKRALAAAECENLDEFLQGNTAWAFGVNDAVEPAKVLADFAKENEHLVIKGGLLEGKRIDKSVVATLAKMPGRMQLLSMMAGAMKQPGTKMAGAMHQSVVKIALAFKALADKKQAAGEAA